MHRSLRAFSIVWLFYMAVAVTHAAPPPTEDFFRPFKYRSMVLSPSGRYLATLYPSNDTTNLAVIDLDGKTSTAITGYPKINEVLWVGWKSDDRLLYELRAHDRDLTSYFLYSVSRDGKDSRAIDAWTGGQFVSWLSDDSDHILLTGLEAGAGGSILKNRLAVYKIFVGSLLSKPSSKRPAPWELYAKAPDNGIGYVADHDGIVRVCSTQEPDGSINFLYRATAAAPWQLLEKSDNVSPSFAVLGFTPDNNSLYVLSNAERDTLALYEYDPKTATRGKLIFEAPGVDLAGAVFSSDHRLLGVEYTLDQTEVHYFEPNAELVQKQLTEVFPRQRVYIESSTPQWRRAVVLAASEHSPGRFYLYDHFKQSVEEIAARAPWIDEAGTAEMRPVHLTARDGLALTAYLILPPGHAARNLPLIVNPHGGPFGIRDRIGWDPAAQFFASRGYAVLKVNFRGSGGFGKSLRVGGIGEFGERMQDDVTDAVLWAIGQGIADKKRICIFGESYGGYAALMGLIRTPELYRCGISYAGVTDLTDFSSWEVFSETGRRVRSAQELAFWRTVLGVHSKDKDYLRAHSPVYNAARINVPVFIAHGGLDLVVPSSQAARMRAALKAAGKSVEYLVKDDEGHGFTDPKNEVELFNQLELFLRANNPPD